MYHAVTYYYHQRIWLRLTPSKSNHTHSAVPSPDTQHVLGHSHGGAFVVLSRWQTGTLGSRSSLGTTRKSSSCTRCRSSGSPPVTFSAAARGRKRFSTRTMPLSISLTEKDAPARQDHGLLHTLIHSFIHTLADSFRPTYTRAADEFSSTTTLTVGTCSIFLQVQNFFF